MKGCITTFSKVRFNVLNPERGDILIEDIAHALSLMTRANGHFSEFFSVAQHSIQCAKEAIARNYVPQVALACLLHDGSEAYLSDITRPVKQNMVMYLQIEEQLQNAIFEKFLGNVPKEEEAFLIKHIDDACLYYEFKHFMNEPIMLQEPIMMSEPVYDFVPMKEVEQEFLQLFHQLTEEIKEQKE